MLKVSYVTVIWGEIWRIIKTIIYVDEWYELSMSIGYSDDYAWNYGKIDRIVQLCQRAELDPLKLTSWMSVGHSVGKWNMSAKWMMRQKFFLS